MSSAVELRGSCSPLSAIALALVAVGVAGCIADITRFGNSAAQAKQASERLSPGSAADVTSGPGEAVRARPRANLASAGSAEVSPLNTTVRVAAPRARPTKISHRHRKATAAAAGRNNDDVTSRADRARGDLTARRS